MGAGRTLVSAVLAAVVVAAVTACASSPQVLGPTSPPDTGTPTPTSTRTTTPSPIPTRTATPTPSAQPPQVTFVSVIDGDTIETSAGTIRIIGIDTPERGECGNDVASAVITEALSYGDPITLELPRGQNDQDRYGRLIRYVGTSSGADLGMLQLHAGTAVARYDSRDGYPAHPREASYHAAQRAALGADGSVIAIGCTVAEAPEPPAVGDRWWEQYLSCTKLKKNTVGHPTGPFDRNDPAQAEPYDWFANRTGNNGDGDGDGLACE